MHLQAHNEKQQPKFPVITSISATVFAANRLVSWAIYVAQGSNKSGCFGRIGLCQPKTWALSVFAFADWKKHHSAPEHTTDGLMKTILGTIRISGMPQPNAHNAHVGYTVLGYQPENVGKHADISTVMHQSSSGRRYHVMGTHHSYGPTSHHSLWCCHRGSLLRCRYRANWLRADT